MWTTRCDIVSGGIWSILIRKCIISRFQSFTQLTETLDQISVDLSG